MVASPVAGFERLTISNTPVSLTPPTTGTPTYALIKGYTNTVTWQDDGTTVTATNGQTIEVGGVLKYDAALSKIRFIRTGASDGEIRVSYYSF